MKSPDILGLIIETLYFPWSAHCFLRKGSNGTWLVAGAMVHLSGILDYLWESSANFYPEFLIIFGWIEKSFGLEELYRNWHVCILHHICLVLHVL